MDLILPSQQHQLLDKLFFTNLISSQRTIDNLCPERKIIITDSAYQSHYASDSLLNLLDLSMEEALQPLEEKAYFTQEVKKEIKKQEDIVMSTKKLHIYYCLRNINDKWKHAIIYKYPIITPETGNVIGVLSEIQELLPHQLVPYLCTIYNINLEENLLIIRKKDKCSLPRLTPREEIISFFILQHLTSAQIAKLITTLEDKNVCPNTVDQIITKSLYNKFNVYSRQALHEELMQHKINTLVPQLLIDKAKKLQGLLII